MADISPYILNEATQNGIEQENNRLDFQHYFFDDIMNNELLPPHIAHELATNPPPRICEMATGSAIWLKEIAKTLPMSAELVGLDFDTSKFPRPETLASNIKLGFANAYEPFPEKFQSHFDVVHLRHFILATKKDHGARLVQNLLSLLRPRGWLVWAECDPIKTNAEPPSDAMFRMQKVYYNHLRNADLETE
ncbi:hypothetical protein NUW58_g2011 [Xylaria curta]|uniref:Uncharacterized protein n=1 Tax=Xylaria curta TaxID=42375 RepID=A0ACC1PI67_9PEZI|nr:hypothetical protein NUW58_g2011 [Xylaria curta]